MRIDEFTAALNENQGVATPNRMRTRFGVPAGLQRLYGGSSTRFLEFWCQDAQVPGYQLLTGNVRRYTYGVNETRPFSPNFQQIQLTYILDNNYQIFEFFNHWMQYILPHESQGGINATTRHGSLPYFLRYKADYATNLVLYVLDKADNIKKTIIVREAFPSNMNPMPHSWSELNRYTELTIAIEFLDWYVEDTTTGGTLAPSSSAPQTNLSERTEAIQNAANIIGTAGSANSVIDNIPR